MSASTAIFVALFTLAIAVLPTWKYSKVWGGGYTPSIFCSMMLAAHLYTVMFVK
ncbi:MAG: DUF3309 domain-containing protein [Betaproteobacteria bacterium]|nr:DUF3309 domain-containing protein [Betaproteobacteria bacterium]